jgi:tetratricopeptide (TPR) repeat protein
MSRKEIYKDENHRISPVKDPWADPGFEILLAPVDSVLFGEISEYMKGFLDTEDVRKDPLYSTADDMARVLVSGYRENLEKNKDNEKFIRDSYTKDPSEEKLQCEISQIKHEINNSNLNAISSEWVEEWHQNQHKNGIKNPKIEEIRDFIADSLEPVKTEPEIRSGESKKNELSKSLITRYISLAAAAITGAVFIVRMLIPSDDPQAIFNKYYETFPAVSSVTRSSGTIGSESFNRAVDSYKSGDYQSATIGFSKALLDTTEFSSASFFLGLTEIELKNYLKAIDLLKEVANKQGDYSKEALWYLGLSYCKAGNEVKASECFDLLARSKGYYSDRSEKILRRLK